MAKDHESKERFVHFITWGDERVRLGVTFDRTSTPDGETVLAVLFHNMKRDNQDPLRFAVWFNMCWQACVLRQPNVDTSDIGAWMEQLKLMDWGHWSRFTDRPLVRGDIYYYDSMY